MKSEDFEYTAGYSEIMAFWMSHPKATPEQIHEFTGEATKRKCDCGLLMRRFECWNGMCEACRKQSFKTERDLECGCTRVDGVRWEERHGWHYDGITAVERCPKYWDAKINEVEIERTVSGVKVKKKATVRYTVSSVDRRKIVATYYDERGDEIRMPKKGGDW